MPQLMSQFGAHGPFVDIAVAISGPRQAALAAAGMPVAPPVIAKGLIDTGASITCIDPHIIKTLGLAPTGACPIHTPSSGVGGGHMCSLFDVAILIFMDANQIHVASITLPVAEAELSHQGAFDALIGRDILSKASLFYNGNSGTFVLSF
jgi:hypothetical protein